MHETPPFPGEKRAAAAMRRAAIALFVVGGVLVLIAFLMAGAATVRPDQMDAASAQQLERLQQQIGPATGGWDVREMMRTSAIVIFVPGMIELLLGAWTRRRTSRVPVACALVLGALILLPLLVMVIGALFQAAANPQVAAAAMVWLLPIALAAWQVIVTLIALRATGPAAMSDAGPPPRQLPTFPTEPPDGGGGYGYPSRNDQEPTNRQG